MLRPEILEQVKKIIPEFKDGYGWSDFRSEIIESGYKPIVEAARQLLDMRVAQVDPSWKASVAGAMETEHALSIEGQFFKHGLIKRDRSKKIFFEGKQFDLTQLQQGETKLYIDINNQYVVDVMRELIEVLPSSILERIRINVNLEELSGTEQFASSSNLVIDTRVSDTENVVLSVVNAITEIRNNHDRYFPEPEKSIPDLVVGLKLPVDQNIGLVEMSSVNSFDSLERNFMLAEIFGQIPHRLTMKEKLSSMNTRLDQLSKVNPGLFQDQRLLMRRRMYLPPLIFYS